MGRKNLSIREEANRKLAKEKRQDESFSDTMERTLQKQGSLLPLWGVLADSKSVTQISDDVAKVRRSAKVRTRL